MNDYYVVLTGTKNNSGDFLIRDRALNLLRTYRSDRELVNYDGWVKPDEKQLSVINNSKALLLTGGPGLRRDMAHVVFAISEVLQKITVPIITFGIGWKSPTGLWENTRQYPLDGATETLLRRIDSSGYLSSVRDEHSLNALMRNGYENFAMTGCPVLFLPEKIGSKIQVREKPIHISFSPGVSFATSKSQEQLTKDLILGLQKEYPEAELSVVFHHSIRPDEHRNAYKNQNVNLLNKSRVLSDWAVSKGCRIAEISGGVDKMLHHYENCDLHVGYRVHAHLLMSSLSQFSVLLSEDGRGKGQQRVLGGNVFDCSEAPAPGLRDKIFNKLKISRPDNHPAPVGLANEIMNHIKYEYRMNFPRVHQARSSIDSLFPVMKSFLQQLP